MACLTLEEISLPDSPPEALEIMKEHCKSDGIKESPGKFILSHASKLSEGLRSWK